MKIIKLSLNRPVTVLMFYLLIIMAGIISFKKLPIEFLPDIGYPKLTIITNYEDSTPEEVEELITIPIEEVVSTLKGTKEVSSISRDEVSVITVKYNWGTDMSYASLDLREKLDNIKHTLPEDADRPNIARLDPSEEPIMYLAVYSKNTQDIIKIQEIAENLIKRRLQQLEGVAAADIIGNREKEIEIVIDEKKVNALGLQLKDIGQSINYANLSNPSGKIKEGQYKYNIKIVGEFRTIEDVGMTPVAYTKNRGAILLKDISEINSTFKKEDNITRLNSNRSLGILVRKESDANTVEVCSTVKESLDILKSNYPRMNFHIALDHSDFIKESIYGVLEAIIIGGFLAFIILFFFLRDFRSPIFIALVIPVAILTAFILMFFSNISLNIISLSGLALGVGMLVDNSIVVSENIFRHKNLNKNWKKAAYDGTKEVGLAITASTLTTLAVFVPIVYVKGITASLFREQALTVTFSLLASLLVSITMLPLLSSLRMKSKKNKLKTKKNQQTGRVKRLLYKFLKIIAFPFIKLFRFIFFVFKMILYPAFKLFSFALNQFHRLTIKFQNKFEKIRSSYEYFLRYVLKNKIKVIFVFILALIISFVILINLDLKFFPDFEQNNFTVQIKTEPGSPLRNSANVVDLIEKKLSLDKRISSFFSSIGKSTEDKLSYYLEDTSTENLAEIKINIHSNYSTNNVIQDLRANTENLPAVITFKKGSNALLSFLEFEDSGLMVNIFGENSQKMKKYGLNIKDSIQKNKDIFYDLKTDFETEAPMIKLKIKRDALSQYSISIGDISRLLATYISGDKISDFHQFNEKFDITLKIKKDLNLEELLDKHIITNNSRIPLRAVVEYEYLQKPEEIKRKNQIRKLSIVTKYEGRTVNAVDKLEEIIQPYRNNDDKIQLEISGVNKEIKQSLKSLVLALCFAVLLVYAILASQFESLKLPFIIMFVAPMGLIGVALILLITGVTINVMSTLGMIILTGIIVNDAILLVDYTNQLIKKDIPLNEAVVKAAKTRLRPILMTTFTTVFGLLPLAFGLGSGAELQSAMAVSVIGGMLAATFLTLVLTPILFEIIEG